MIKIIRKQDLSVYPTYQVDTTAELESLCGYAPIGAYVIKDELKYIINLLRQPILIKGNINRGENNLITVVKDLDLVFHDEEDEAYAFYTAVISPSLFPSDFLTARGKYNLIVVVTGEYEDSSAFVSYVANHFCFNAFDENSMLGYCSDDVELSEITHYTSIARNSADDDFIIEYQGLLGGSRVLDDVGAKISVYLQPFWD